MVKNYILHIGSIMIQCWAGLYTCLGESLLITPVTKGGVEDVFI